jgi:hypothetical protein
VIGEPQDFLFSVAEALGQIAGFGLFTAGVAAGFAQPDQDGVAEHVQGLGAVRRPRSIRAIDAQRTIRG